MEKCERCKKSFYTGTTLKYGRALTVETRRFCSGTCALVWNRMCGPALHVEIKFDEKSPFDRMTL